MPRAKVFYEYARYRDFKTTLRLLRELMGPPIHHNQHGQTFMFADGTLLKAYTTKPGWAWFTAQRHIMARMVAR